VGSRGNFPSGWSAIPGLFDIVPVAYPKPRTAAFLPLLRLLERLELGRDLPVTYNNAPAAPAQGLCHGACYRNLHSSGADDLNSTPRGPARSVFEANGPLRSTQPKAEHVTLISSLPANARNSSRTDAPSATPSTLKIMCWTSNRS
jgi:hypothetical protein